MARPRAATLTVAAALAVVLSLRWFAFTPPPPAPPPSGSGILNLLDTYTPVHTSGWAGLGRLTVALIGLAAAGVVAALRAPAVVVAGAALAALVLDLAANDEGIVVRWPAYVGIALTGALLACAVWSWRARGSPQA